jgi:mannose-1-phosphate guanylyltransferase
VLGATRCLIVNGDTLTDLDLKALWADHARTGALVTMATVEGDLSRYNALLASADGTLRGTAPAGTSAAALQHEGLSAVHFIGIQIAERSTFDGVSSDAPSETVREIYPAILERRPGAIRVWTSAATFYDVGTPARYHETVATFAGQEGRGFDRGSHVDIDPTAAVTRVVCWDRVHVGAGARLTDCVLADDVRVPAGVRLERASVVRRADRAPAPGDRVVGDTVVVPFEPAWPVHGAGRE